MIDCHVHTKRSHHGIGDLEDFVEVALELDLKILGFTEHAPLSFDKKHRLTERETDLFIKDVKNIANKYSDKIKILSGLEIDYYPSEIDLIKKITAKYSADYFYGAIHFFEKNNQRLSVWDYEDFQDEKTINIYFKNLEDAIRTDLFDGVVHPDLILRSGINKKNIYDKFKNIMDSIKMHNQTYEINCSGITKSKYDPSNKKMIEGEPSFPYFDIVKYGIQNNNTFTIGSDAHSPDKLYANIKGVINILTNLGLKKLNYFENRVLKEFIL